MPFTYREYPRFSVTLSVEDCSPTPNERKQCGDIISCHYIDGTLTDHGDTGTAVPKLHILLHLEGLDRNEMDLLKAPNEVPFNPEGKPLARYDKRRYCIPFERLKKVYPTFDIAKAKDPTLVYQPFVLIQGDPPYDFLQKHRSFDVHGLVFDKVEGRYL